MPFWRSYAHLVWTTKERSPWITAHIEAQLYAQLVDSAAKLGCYVYSVNGMPDHVHVVLSVPPKHSIAYVVKMLKGSSAHFVNHVLRPVEYHFQWQRGYGYLTLGQTQLARAITYVERQKEHHSQQSFNRWLEWVDEKDEGPVNSIPPEPSTGVVRETGAAYEASLDWP